MSKLKDAISNPQKHFLLWVSITIALGAVGSGLWESMLKPSTGWLKDWLLNVGTLGVDSFRNSLYAKVGNGHREAAATHSYSLLVQTLVATGCVLACAPVILLNRRTAWIRHRAAMLAAKSQSSPQPTSTSAQGLRSSILQAGSRKVAWFLTDKRGFLWSAVLYIVFFAVVGGLELTGCDRKIM